MSEVLTARCVLDSLDPEDLVLEFVGPDGDLTDFWERVDTNLAGGRIRLIFLSDHNGPELRQIIEFLNAQFQRAEVIGIEVRQWKGEAINALVSDVIGRTTAAAAAKGHTQSPSRLTPAEFDDLLNAADSEDADAVRSVMKWCTEHGGFISYGTGRSWPACYLNWRTAGGTPIWPLVPTLPTNVSVAFDRLATRPPFDSEPLREEFRQKLCEIKGVQLEPDSINRRPSSPLNAIRAPAERSQLVAALSWFIAKLKHPPPPDSGSANVEDPVTGIASDALDMTTSPPLRTDA